MSKVVVVANSHIDPVWLWDKYEGIDEVVNTFRSACDRLDENPDLFFTASSTCFYKWVSELAPDVFSRISSFVKQGRWEVAGAWWVEGDVNLPLRDSLLASAKLSRKWLSDNLGVNPVVAFSPDTFGHPACLPSVLAETGFKFYLFCRPGKHENSALPADLFWWRHGNDRILCYRLPYHYCPSADKLASAIQDSCFLAAGLGCFFFGVGDHGGGPTKAEIAKVREIMASSPNVEVVFGTLESFFREACLLSGIPEYEGDLHYHAVGCYSVNRDLKEGVRKAERALAFAERIGCNGLDPIWETVLFNQFHDIMPGSCAPSAAKKALAELGGALSSAEEAAYQKLKSLSSATPVSYPEGEFRIYNSLNHEVAVPLEIESFMYFKPGARFCDSDGNEVPIQLIQPSVTCANVRWLFIDSIPAKSFKRYHFEGDQSDRRAVPKYSLGSRVAQGDLVATAPGQVTYAGEALFSVPLTLSVIEDNTDTWSHGIEGYGPAFASFQPESSSILEGPIVSYLCQSLRFDNSFATMTFALYRGLPFFDVDLLVQWQERQRLLKMVIAPRNPFESWTVQGMAGAINKETKNREEPLHGWVSAGGLCLLQDGAFAADRFDGSIRVTLVRSSYYGYHEPFELDRLAPLEPTDVGKHRFRFRFMLQADDLDKAFAAFIEPYRVLRENA